MPSEVPEVTETCACAAKEHICQECQGEGYVAPLPEGEQRSESDRCACCSGRGGHQLPHDSSCPVMVKDSGLQYYAPQLLSWSDGSCMYSRGVMSEAAYWELLELLFGSRD